MKPSRTARASHKAGKKITKILRKLEKKTGREVVGLPISHVDVEPYDKPAYTRKRVHVAMQGESVFE